MDVCNSSRRQAHGKTKCYSLSKIVTGAGGSWLSKTTVTMTAADNGCPEAAQFRCVNTSFCVPPGWLCDTINDCGDMSDEGPLAGCTGG